MDKKINKIMACVDFSDYSLLVMEYAVELAKESDAQIVVYNVINHRDVHMVGMVSAYAAVSVINVNDYIKDVTREREAMIKDLIKEHFFQEKSRMSFKIEVGVPFEQILKAIETEAVDLVVIANKGRGNISRVLFGSAAEKVFRHSPVPVVSVRDRKKFKREKHNEKTAS